MHKIDVITGTTPMTIQTILGPANLADTNLSRTKIGHTTSNFSAPLPEPRSISGSVRWQGDGHHISLERSDKDLNTHSPHVKKRRKTAPHTAHFKHLSHYNDSLHLSHYFLVNPKKATFYMGIYVGTLL